MKKHPFFWGIFCLFSMALLFFFFSKIVVRHYGDGEDGGKEKIAVVDVNGIITESDEIVRKLKKYGKDSSIRGIIVRINSPGGGVAPSQEIYSEILRLRRDKGKRVVASFASLGASGGYYIASAADKIIANPGTITGSIGVIMPFSNMEDLLGKIGMKAGVVKSGKFKDLASPTREMTPEERDILQASVNDVHSQFIEAIAKGRGMEAEKVRALADGRIYTGRQALEAGLVDKLGGFEDAVDLLAELASMKGEPGIIREKEEKGLLFRLIKGDAESLLREGLFNHFSGFQYLWK